MSGLNSNPMNSARMSIPVFIAVLCVVAVIVVLALLRNKPDRWQDRIAKPELTEEEFTEIFSEVAMKRFPELDVKVTGPLELLIKSADGTEWRCWLGNTWGICAHIPEIRADTCNDYIESFAQQINSREPPPLKDDMGSIIPKLESSEYLDGLGLNKDGSKPYVAEHLAADIWVEYARRIENRSMLLHEDDLLPLNLTMAELHSTAVRNLRDMLPEVRLQKYEAGYWGITADGNHDTALLVIDKLWENPSIEVDGDLVAAVPCRGILLVTGSNSAEGVERLRKVIERAWQEGAYLISKSLLVRRDGKWQLFAD